MAEGYAFLSGLEELRDVTWIDLPTSHWPMWSRPRDLAAILGDVAAAGSGTAKAPAHVRPDRCMMRPLKTRHVS
jgi:hypothetical protein